MLGFGPIGAFAIGQGPAQTAEIVTVDKWFPGLSTPVRTRTAGAAIALAASGNVYPPQPPLVSFAYYNWLTEPVRLRPRLLPGAQPFLALQPFPIISIEWWQPLSQPPKLAKPGLPAGQQAFLAWQPAPSPFVATGWYNWLGEPVRLKRGLGAHLQRAFTIDTSVTPSPAALIGWFQAFREPVRYRQGLQARLQQFLAHPPRLLPTPTVSGTLNAVESGDTALFGGVSFGRVVTAQIGLTEISFTGAYAGLIEQSQALSAAPAAISETGSTTTSGAAVPGIAMAAVTITPR